MLLEFYQNLGFDINVVKNPEKYFAGELENDEGIKLVVIHTGNVHRLYAEKMGLHCFIIPNSYIEHDDVETVKNFISISVFFKSLFPKVYQQIP